MTENGSPKGNFLYLWTEPPEMVPYTITESDDDVRMLLSLARSSVYVSQSRVLFHPAAVCRRG